MIKEKIQSFNMEIYPEFKRIGKIDFEKYDEVEKLGHSRLIGMDDWKRYGVKFYKTSSFDQDIDDLLNLPQLQVFNELESYPYGVHRKLRLQVEAKFNAGYILVIPDNCTIDEPLMIDYYVRPNEALLDQTMVKIGKNSRATLILRYMNEDNLSMEAYQSGIVKVVALEHAKLTLGKLQLLNDDTIHLHQSVALIKDQAEVKFMTFDLGGSIVLTDVSNHLEGTSSQGNVQAIYLGEKDRRLDIGFNTVHYGRRSESLVECKGALLGSSKKIFRGNLRFKRGAKKSKGRESEYVLLLDERVHSDAIPALLCDEDDVIGEHAASAGQINEQQLFYLMSRGFSAEEAKKLIIHGSFATIIDLLPTESLRLQVEDEIERRLLNEG